MGRVLLAAARRHHGDTSDHARGAAQPVRRLGDAPSWRAATLSRASSGNGTPPLATPETSVQARPPDAKDGGASSGFSH